MNTQLKQRLIGVIILVVFLAIAIPFLMSGSKKPQKTEQSTTSETSTTTSAATTETAATSNNTASTLPNHQPTIQFNTPEGKTIDNQKPAANALTTSTSESGSTAAATSITSQTTQTLSAANEKQNQNKPEGENQPPVFQHQPTTPATTSNIATNNLPLKTTSTTTAAETAAAAATNATDDEDDDDAGSSTKPKAIPSANTSSPTSSALQQSITQKETAIISNKPIATANNYHTSTTHRTSKSIKPKIKATQQTKPKTTPHKKKPKVISTPTTENASSSNSADNDLQRLLNEEKIEMRKSKPKTSHKNDDLVDPDI